MNEAHVCTYPVVANGHKVLVTGACIYDSDELVHRFVKMRASGVHPLSVPIIFTDDLGGRPLDFSFGEKARCNE